MTTLSLSLPEDMKAFVEAQAAAEGHASASEYLQVVIRDLQKRKAKQELEAKLLEALASGPAELMTREDWESIEREALERIASEANRPWM